MTSHSLKLLFIHYNTNIEDEQQAISFTVRAYTFQLGMIWFAADSMV